MSRDGRKYGNKKSFGIQKNSVFKTPEGDRAQIRTSAGNLRD